MRVRKAETKDIPGLRKLLMQVLEVHARLRPDIFIPGTAKYSESELEAILADENRPIFAAVNEEDRVIGYAMCQFQHRPHSDNMTDILTLYIDDICVDENERGKGIASAIYSHVGAYASEKGCYHITLNVWSGNDRAVSFYEHMGLRPMETVMEDILKK